MDGYQLSKSKGKGRSDKFRNKSKKIHAGTRPGKYSDTRRTHYGNSLKEENMKKHMPNFCTECFTQYCEHMQRARLSLIWKGKLTKCSPLSTLPRDILRIIWFYAAELPKGIPNYLFGLGDLDLKLFYGTCAPRGGRFDYMGSEDVTAKEKRRETKMRLKKDRDLIESY